MEDWKFWIIIGVNLIVGIAIYFKDAINSLFLGKVQRQERRQERTREILIQLHDYQTRFFSALSQLAINGFLRKQDPAAVKEYERLKEEMKNLKCQGGSIAELPSEVREKVKPLVDEIVECHTRTITIVESRSNEEFLKRYKDLTDIQSRVLNALQKEIDQL